MTPPPYAMITVMSADKPLTEKRLSQLLDGLKLAIQMDLVALEKRLKKHTSDEVSRVANDIIATSDERHNEVIERLDNLELNSVKRSEFDALKRKVERLVPTN